MRIFSTIRYYQGVLWDRFLFTRLREKLGNNQEDQLSPLFIVGSGRSGTTLLRRVVTENFDYNIPPESGSILPRLLKQYSIVPKAKHTGYIESAMEILQNDSDFAIWNLDLKKLREKLAKKEYDIAEIIQLIYREYAAQHNIDSLDWGDKTPYLTYYLKWLFLVFPNAQFIHIYRNPVQVIQSRIRNFGEDFDTACNRWYWAMKEFTNFKRKFSSANTLELSLEHLQQDFDFVKKEISKFLAIEPLAEKKSFPKTGDLTLSHMSAVTDSIKFDSRKSVFLDEAQLARIRKLMYKLPSRYHYVI